MEALCTPCTIKANHYELTDIGPTLWRRDIQKYCFGSTIVMNDPAELRKDCCNNIQYVCCTHSLPGKVNGSICEPFVAFVPRPHNSLHLGTIRSKRVEEWGDCINLSFHCVGVPCCFRPSSPLLRDVVRRKGGWGALKASGKGKRQPIQ